MNAERPMGNADEDKRGIEAILMGMPDKDIQMGEPEITETVKKKLRGQNAEFQITAGPRLGNSPDQEGQYVLSITYSNSEEAQKKNAALGGWSQGIGSEFGREANELARDFCKRNGFTVAAHALSWPEFQAVLVKS